MNRIFHSPPPLAQGVRLRVLERDDLEAASFRPLNQHLLTRLISGFLTLLLFLSSSPVLFASMARDVMGGGGGKGGAANLQNAGAASASLTASRARAVLQQTDAQLAALKSLQASARALMAPAGTPNGLAAGWLETRDGFSANGTPLTTSWQGAAITSANGSTAVNIVQSQQNAYLYWKSFSVGPQTTLNFDQSAGGNDVGNWIAFNKVMGNVSPSHIYGQISAQGQIYILNQNGILFHNGSQVNTHSLVASTLPINENLAGDALNNVNGRGIANNPDYQFLFTALPVTSGTLGPTAAFTPAAAPAGGIGDVVVEQGASITSPANSSHTGGLVALIGPNVQNNGSISTPNGQTILAAGLQVGLTPHTSSDPSLRGMDVYVGKVSDPTVSTISTSTGTAENNGLIEISEGNATITGKTVNQNGIINSSTSVSLNGRIDLQAVYNDSVTAVSASQTIVQYNSTGTVNLGAGSVMRILPEWNSSETITGTSLALNSIVSITGSQVNLGSGSILLAPGAIGTSGALSQMGDSLPSGVVIRAGNWYTATSASISQFIYTAGDITMASDATINVAGSTGINVDSSKNFLTLQLRGAEFSNSPLQRTGTIRGVSLTLDQRITGTYNGQYWIGTPLGDATGYVGLIEKTVGELTTQGGTVSINAGNSVVMQGGSAINVSGGWVQYSGGNFATTKLIYQGHLIDISQATPDRVYSGVYSGGGTVEKSAKWGVTITYGTSPLDPGNKQYEAPYVQGAAGGDISIQAPSVVLNGSLDGETVAGPRQVRSSASLSTLPADSLLVLDLHGDTVLSDATVHPASPYAPAIAFADNAISTQSSLVLAPDLLSTHGFGNLTILNHDGSITLPANTALDAGINGSVTLEAANISIDGSIKAPGGSVSLTADLAPYGVLNALSLLSLPNLSVLDVVQYQGSPVAQYGPVTGGVTQVVQADGTILSVNGALPHLQAGIVTVGPEAKLSTAGVVTDDALNSPNRYQAIALNGGAVSITGYQVNLVKGSTLDVSGGALIPAMGSVTYGYGGTIAITAGQDTSSRLQTIHNGSLVLASTLNGYGGIGAAAGTLSIQAPAIQIGGNSPDPRVLNISSDFFNQGGFGTFNLSGIGVNVPGSTTDFIPGVTVTAGTEIHPEVSSLLLTSSANGPSMHPFLQPTPYRAVANLSLNALRLVDGSLPADSQLIIRGDLLMEQGSSIIVDPQVSVKNAQALAATGSIKLSGDTVTEQGSLFAPGGVISITGASSFPQNGPSASAAYVSVDLSPTATLSTAGEALYVNDPLGIRKNFGTVLSGGSISVSGNILAEAGAILNASGASGVYELLPYQLGSSPSSRARSALQGGGNSDLVTPYSIDSSGGSISMKGAQLLYTDATLVARSGGPTALGGNLVLSSGLFTGGANDFNLAVSQSGVSIPAAFTYSGSSAIGQSVPVAGQLGNGGGHIAVSSFNDGGFDSLSLGGNVIFNGAVSLAAPGMIKIATGGGIAADSLVSITSAYVALGTPFAPPLSSGQTPPQLQPPSHGTGGLNVSAKLIDLGNLSLQNIGTAKLVADGGVIRGDGTVDIAGDLVLRAAQVYPVTGVKFTLIAYNHDAATGSALSSGGVDGSIMIQQSGALPLPLSALGSLSLYASSISQGGTLVAPFGTINLGSDAGATAPLDPVTGLTVPAAKNLILTAGSITSVSAIDPLNGQAITVPYGTSADGTSWVDPSGNIITTTGLPNKSVNLAAQNVITESGSLVDLQGGGNLVASQWISGQGGTINMLGTAAGAWSSTPSYSAGDLVTYKGSTWSARQDNTGVSPSVGLYWSMLPQSYAIVPGYQSLYAPTGYSDGSLGVGSQIKISGGAGLPAGIYTLLPASYAATQSGAFLISPSAVSSSLAGSFTQPDGSVLVSGTLVNGLDTSYSAPKTTTLYQLFPPRAVAQEVQYSILDASTFFKSTAGSSQPADAANLVIKAAAAMNLLGGVMGNGANGGRGANIDLSSAANFLIGNNSSVAPANTIFLNSTVLSGWNAGSLLIGGTRTVTASGITVTPSTSQITVDNAGSSLTSPDLILASKNAVIINNGSSLAASGDQPASPLTVSGDGALVRVSSDQGASVTRTGNDNAAVTGFSIGANASLSGGSITLDSSGNASMASSALLDGRMINLDAGKMALNFDGSSQVNALNLSGSALQSLSAANALNLTSYSSLEFHGSGVLGSSSLASLGLHAGEILGDNNGADTILASSILLDNANASTDPSGGAPVATGGSLAISGSQLTLDSGNLSIGGFQNISATLASGVQGTGKGALVVAQNLTFSTPIFTGAGSAVTSITAGGSLQINDPGTAALTSGLGASLTLKGASVAISAPISLPSGSLSVEATSGDLTIASRLDVGGVSRQFFDVTQYTSGGTISLTSDNGNLNLLLGSSLNLSAPTAAANAGTLALSAPKGTTAFGGTISATAPNGTAGSFTMDVNGFNGGNLAALESSLTADGFTHSQNLRIRSGDVSVANAKALSYTLSADAGSISVTGTIDAHGTTGGSITLQASGDIIVNTGSELNVHGDNYDAAGKGGSIFLSAGAETGGNVNSSAKIDLQNGSTIDLGVTATARSIDIAGDSDQFGGVLHLRTPENALQNINLASTITGASSIEVEGYNLYDLTGTSGEITQAVRDGILSDAQNFYGIAGTDSANALAILAQLIAHLDPATAAHLNLATGVEIINQSGDLTLNSDWDLSGFRTGANSAPGFLTLRASGNITLNASLSDGFASSFYNANLLNQSVALPANFQSWSYQLTSGSDLTAVSAKTLLPNAAGNVALGIPYVGGQNVAQNPGLGALTSQAIDGYFQVIRTGTGDIGINAAGDFQLWNQFSSVYTAGVQVTDPTLEAANGIATFDTPVPNFTGMGINSLLGVTQQATAYKAQYSYGGGNIEINTGGNITHLTLDNAGNAIADSVRELPSNWLYRRGSVGSDGLFQIMSIRGGRPVATDVASTTWWVDFSNFFEGIGALGGGNVTLNATGNISNVDAVIPTNFRMPGKDATGNRIIAGSVSGVELGGGNLSVTAGNNIDAGIYYVERGNGNLSAGGSIITNPTRDPAAPTLTGSTASDPSAYLPTSLFLGKGSFNVQANGDILLGPVANVFLSPQGVNNSFWYKTYFSTYAQTDSVTVASLGGNILFRESGFLSTTSSAGNAVPLLQLWENGLLASGSDSYISYYQPWLKLAEDSSSVIDESGVLLSLAPPSLYAAALSGSISFQGNYTASPSSVGNITLISSGGINGLALAGKGNGVTSWRASEINLSDANPASIASVSSPLSQRSGLSASAATFSINNISSDLDFVLGISSLFGESGSYSGIYASLTIKQSLHDSTLLHAGDEKPVQFYALGGDISGLTLFSPKMAEISAGGNINDIGLYIQNTASSDVSLVSAGGVITGYDPNSSLQNLAQSAAAGAYIVPLQSGDIQISGPGTLEVLAGGNIDLGNGPNRSDGTGVGITSIGNARNPALPFAGADIIVGAGVKLPYGLSSPNGLALQNFVDTVIKGSEGDTYLSELAATMTYSGDPLSGTITAASFDAGSTQLTAEEKARLELQLFYIVLRDTGRNHNKVGSSGYGSYTTGEQAIAAFFESSVQSGSVTTWARDIRTKNGGNINIFAPEGGVTLATTAPSSASITPGIVTEHGGSINIYAQQSVTMPFGRIFTLRGGDIMIWSDKGNIAAGSASKTVASAPPTRVLIDPQSGNVLTDLSGLATGGGIGVLATVKDAPVGNVDLIAPSGVIDAGDAGIRSSGNLNLAATKVLNADNIAVSGTTAGAPPAPPPPAAPNVSGASAAAAAGAASTSTAATAANNNSAAPPEPPASIISVEVLGYGGSDAPEDSAPAPTTSSGSTPPPQAAL